MCGAQKPSATPLYQQYLSAMTSFKQKVATALAKVQRASIKLDTAIYDRIKTVDCFYQAKSKEEKRKHGLRVRETELRQIIAQAELRQLYYRDGFYQNAFEEMDFYLAFRYEVPRTFLRNICLFDSESSSESEGPSSEENPEPDW